MTKIILKKIARDDYYLSNKGEVILGCQKTKIRLAQNLRKNKSKLNQNYPSIDIVKNPNKDIIRENRIKSGGFI
ncbi:Uncharacterised protein [Staphylococcus aureus]|uniref:Uncharacterized protein n=1 Tax=Staphylococcus aureus TaxID=1280 RepID=A0A380DKR3_STAAU|nr:Uncharacterised protein [Staphylococcus aureus]